MVLPTELPKPVKSVNKKTRKISRNQRSKSAERLKITVAGLLALAPAARAQQVIIPPPQYPTAPPAVQQAEQENPMEVFNPEAAPGATPERQPFQFGIFNVRPHPFYRLLYAHGILANTNDLQNTLIQQISPGFLIEVGQHWSLDYTPTWSFYSNRNFRDSLDHALQLTGQTSYEDWTLGLSQGVTLSSDPTVQTGTQTSQQAYSTALNASYRFNSTMSTDLGLYQNIIAAQQFESSREWLTLDWLNYQFWPRLQVGVGAGVGYVAVDTGPNSIYEQYQGRIDWRATDKISFQVHGGLEDRQFQGGNSDLFSFIFGAAIQYQPFDPTRITLNAFRTVSQSYFQSQVTEDTGLTCELDQRLFNHLSLDVNGGYHTVKYLAAAAGAGTDRTDNYYSVSFQLNYNFLKRANVAAFYQLSDDSSSEKGFSYYSSQVGFQVGLQY